MLPSGALWPAGTDWVSTVLLKERNGRSTFTLKPAPSSARFAASTSWPATFGTGIWRGPLETVSVTVSPAAAWAPALSD